ncbi:carbonic anhydrase [Hazenella sp. IB182357]|uniref:carbonic anhydrase n=1 Tax=Polycladospora coralii TaxID=2771432 RepID=A0A926RW76_9BACL|nr:carbonic anhydrase [Polycladospora coralii]MBD1371206.1 carbonic anhydrase [Polycladospora coralii]
MEKLKQILAFNEQFVETKGYLPYMSDKFPNARLLIVTCMDTRLTELLPQAMNIKNGDAKILRVAGAMITEPYGSIMRSVLVAVTQLKVEEIMVVGHHDCGMVGLEGEQMIRSLQQKGISVEKMKQFDKPGETVEAWLTGVNSVEGAVLRSVQMIKEHPLFPHDIPVHALTITPDTGKLEVIHVENSVS